MSFPDFYSNELPENVQLAFQTLYAQLRSFAAVSFNDDGTLIPAAPNVGVCPIGTINMFGGASAPAKWLLCDGTAVSRVTYKDLFAAIGTAYGAGDGSTTFALPDLRQRFPMGKAASGTGATLGQTFGAIDHVHTAPSHTHTVSGSTGAATVTISGSTATGGDHNHGGATGNHTHSFSTGAPDTTNEAIARNDTIYSVHVVSGNSDHIHTGTTDGSTASIGSSGTHTHGAGTLAGGSHSHTAGTLAADAAGAGNTGTANPPGLAVNFIILAGV